MDLEAAVNSWRITARPRRLLGLDPAPVLVTRVIYLAALEAFELWWYTRNTPVCPILTGELVASLLTGNLYIGHIIIPQPV